MRLVKVRHPFPTRKPLRSNQIVDIEGWKFADRFIRRGALVELTEAEINDFFEKAGGQTPELLKKLRYVAETSTEAVAIATGTEEAETTDNTKKNLPLTSILSRIEEILTRKNQSAEIVPAEIVPADAAAVVVEDAASSITSAPNELETTGGDLSAAAKKQPVTKTVKKDKSVLINPSAPADNTEQP